MESIDRLREYVKEHASSEWAYATAPPKYPLVNCADVDLLEIADAIEREVKANRVDAYTKGYDAGFASADDWAAQHEDAMAEHGWVRKSKEHVVSHATVEVTPHIDWSHMADELDVFTQLVRDFAEQVEEDE